MINMKQWGIYLSLRVADCSLSADVFLTLNFTKVNSLKYIIEFVDTSTRPVDLLGFISW